jgi:hypothetical protein
MRTGVTVYVSSTDRKRLQAIVDDRNSPQKHVWRARIVLAGVRAEGPEKKNGSRGQLQTGSRAPHEAAADNGNKWDLRQAGLEQDSPWQQR